MNDTTTTLDVHQCTQCGKTLFPARYFCPACGGANWRRYVAQTGTVMETTIVRHRAGAPGAAPLYLATVHTDAGPAVIACSATPLADKTRVSLMVDAAHRIVASALDTPEPSGDRYADQ
ncbi:Zn-ribbon domain-containing OB-fold protein [Paraburkholderia sp. J67]|uniref:Zn-ribbon domain-containing OB-fold protein n=1 Tax=Paraburkholderia sp. J67 TaxID=2805435 RepID=UPI002ABDF498|nr:zinc ribbon domain-containing protein [Paraburkholderia sp. J67]